MTDDIPNFSFLNGDNSPSKWVPTGSWGCLLDKAFRRGDIESVLENLAKQAGHAGLGGGLLVLASSIISPTSGGPKFSKMDVKRVFLNYCLVSLSYCKGNWLKDYSQVGLNRQVSLITPWRGHRPWISLVSANPQLTLSLWSSLSWVLWYDPVNISLNRGLIYPDLWLCNSGIWGHAGTSWCIPSRRMSFPRICGVRELTSHLRSTLITPSTKI